jgi:secreted PhoX family phosphatase
MVFVAEDGDDLQLVLIAGGRNGLIVAPFLQLDGHAGSELTGPVFSPDGRRLYLSSQRGRDGRGMTFEISGPF